MDKAKISERIRAARKKAGMSQADLAERMGIGISTFKNFEEGNVNYWSENFEKFEKATGVSIEELLVGFNPEEISDCLLNDSRNIKEKYNAMVLEYEQRLQDKEALILSQKGTIDIIQRQNGVLEGIITKLSKND